MSARTKKDLWYSHKPKEIGWRGGLSEGHIWQFLLPAEDMARFDADKSIAEFASDAQKQIKAWRKDGFFARLEPHEVKLLQKLSRIAEDLFDIVADDLARSRAATNDAITLWPDKEMPGARGLDFHEKDHRLQKLIGADRAANTLPYKRLKTAMDAWCALWLWPLDKVDLLPSRQEFLHGMTLILEGGFLPDGSITAPSIAEFAQPERNLFVHGGFEEGPLKPPSKKKQGSLFRETDVDALIEEIEWLGVASEVARRERFTHYDLIFADVLRDRGGFDVIVGNPPWAKPAWNEADVLGDIDPRFVVRRLSAADTRVARTAVLSKDADRKAFLSAYASAKGAMTVTGSEIMNPFAGGGQNNLYRCFIDLAFREVSTSGYVALIHQDGHLMDPKSGAFRQEWYTRIAKHFEFSNRITSKNFAEVDHNLKFSLNIYRGTPGGVSFEQFTNAFLASQIEDSYRHDGVGELPTLKNSDGKWDVRGHRDRLVRIDGTALKAVHALSEEEATPLLRARFVQPYSAKMLDVFRVMAAAPSLAELVPRVGSDHLEGSAAGWQMSSLLHETGAQKAGIIRRETAFRRRSSEMVISGPMFHIGNPFYKTPKAVCRTNADYEVIDLSIAAAHYTPRTNYAPAVGMQEYIRELPRCSWDPTKSHVDFYRFALRNMVALNGERSLIGAVISPGVAHVNTVKSVAFKEPEHLLALVTGATSLVFDFIIKASGRGHLFGSDMARLPFVNFGDTAKHRSLRLACLTHDYAELWNENTRELAPLSWHSSDPRLALDGPIEGPKTWDRMAALRTDFSRRMALVEVDVLVAQALGLILSQLIDIYRIHFPVLQQYEAATWYDQKGFIVWTASKGLPGIGFLEDGKKPARSHWDQILASGKTLLECEATIDFLPGGPQRITRIFEGPFDTCNRIEDYRRAWAYFEKHREGKAAA
jgi:hypothetical protein